MFISLPICISLPAMPANLNRPAGHALLHAYPCQVCIFAFPCYAGLLSYPWPTVSATGTYSKCHACLIAYSCHACLGTYLYHSCLLACSCLVCLVAYSLHANLCSLAYFCQACLPAYLCHACLLTFAWQSTYLHLPGLSQRPEGPQPRPLLQTGMSHSFPVQPAEVDHTAFFECGTFLFLALYVFNLVYNFPRKNTTMHHKLLYKLGCFPNSICFFITQYIPYSIRNCPKFHGIRRNPVLRNSLNSAEFPGFWCNEILHNFNFGGVNSLKCFYFRNNSAQMAFEAIRNSVYTNLSGIPRHIPFLLYFSLVF